MNKSYISLDETKKILDLFVILQFSEVISCKLHLMFHVPNPFFYILIRIRKLNVFYARSYQL